MVEEFCWTTNLDKDCFTNRFPKLDSVIVSITLRICVSTAYLWLGNHIQEVVYLTTVSANKLQLNCRFITWVSVSSARKCLQRKISKLRVLNH